MKDAVKLIAATGLFCLVAGLLLAWTNAVTKAPIEKAKKEELMRGLRKVLPACDNDVLADAKTVQDNGREWVFYIGRKAGKVVGVALKSASDKGYGGTIEVLVGLLPDGRINDLEIYPLKETPGLGTKVAQPAFRGQFKGRQSTDARWAALKKDGGEIQGVTGATISSRAATAAVKAGLEAFARRAKEIPE